MSTGAGKGGDPVRGRKLSTRARIVITVAVAGWLAIWLVAFSVSADWGSSREDRVLWIGLGSGVVLLIFVLPWLVPEDDWAVVIDRLQESAGRLLQLLGWLVVMAVPVLVGQAVLSVSDVPVAPVRWVAFALLLLVLLATLVLMRRPRFSSWLDRQPLLVSAWVFAGTVALLAASVFAGGTWELYSRGWVELDPVPANALALLDLFVYYLVSAIPGSIPQRLKWDEPFTYTQWWVGALILIYMVVVVTPVVGFVRERWRKRPAARPRSSG